ncbi:MAG: type II secretion system protein N [Pseudomonadales bacterium]|nr:type II secretion system protein N [Pseudomonadales bacterium]
MIGTLSYLAFVLANIPTSFVVNQAGAYVKQQDIAIGEATGTVWNGAVTLLAKHNDNKLPPISMSWRLQLLKILIFQPPFHYQINGVGFQLEGDLGITPRMVSIANTEGQLSSSLINNFTKAEGVEISGQVELKDLNLTINFLGRETADAEGELYWGGGEVVYKQGSHPISIDFPAVKGVFSHNEGSLELKIADAAEGKVIGNIEIAPTGWAKVSVMKRVLEMAGQMNVGKNGDKPLIEVQQKLF